MEGAVAENLFKATPFTKRKERAQKVASFLFGSVAFSILIPLLVLLVFIFYKAWPVLSWDLIVDVPRKGMRAGGLWTPIVGTAYLVFFSMLVATPLGVLAAVYLNEFAGDNWLTRIINLAVINLAGVPSIVHGLFGFGAFVLYFGLGKSILSASFTLAIMILPVIIAATKEALSAVPMAFREACWNLGASKWQTVRTIVLPNAISGILTGVILGVCRVAGEAAPILFTGAVFYKAITAGTIFAYSPTEQCMALSLHLFTLSTQVPGVPEPLLYGTAAVLISSAFIFNALAIGFRIYFRSRKKW